MSNEIIGNVDWSAVYDALKTRNIRLVLAFPGTGKTSCVRGMRDVGKEGGPPIVADFDIKGVGNDRANVDLVPGTQGAMGDLVNQLMKDDIIVFTFLHYLNFDRINPKSGNVLVTIPVATPEEWADRVRKRGDSDRFVNLIRKNFDTWISDWRTKAAALAKRLNVTIVPVRANEYLSDAILNLSERDHGHEEFKEHDKAHNDKDE